MSIWIFQVKSLLWNVKWNKSNSLLHSILQLGWPVLSSIYADLELTSTHIRYASRPTVYLEAHYHIYHDWFPGEWCHITLHGCGNKLWKLRRVRSWWWYILKILQNHHRSTIITSRLRYLPKIVNFVDVILANGLIACLCMHSEFYLSLFLPKTYITCTMSKL